MAPQVRRKWERGARWKVTVDFRVWESKTGLGAIRTLHVGTIIELGEFPEARVLNDKRFRDPVMINALVFMEPYEEEETPDDGAVAEEKRAG